MTYPTIINTTTNTSSTITNTFNHTVPTGLNDFCIVMFVDTRQGPNDNNLALVSSLTYDGEIVQVLLQEIYLAGQNRNMQMAIGYLQNPHTGTNVVEVVWDNPPNSVIITVMTIAEAGSVDILNWSTSFSTTASITQFANYDTELVVTGIYNSDYAPVSFSGNLLTDTNNGNQYQSITYLNNPTSGNVTMSTAYPSAPPALIGMISIRQSIGFIPQILII